MIIMEQALVRSIKSQKLQFYTHTHTHIYITNSSNIWFFVNHFLLCHVVTQIYATYTFENIEQLCLFKMSIHSYTYSEPMSMCL